MEPPATVDVPPLPSTSRPYGHGLAAYEAWKRAQQPPPAPQLVRVRARTTVALKGALDEHGQPARNVREGRICQVPASVFDAHKDLFDLL